MTGPVRDRAAMGGWMAGALVVGNMIGSGIFLLPASLGAYGGISLLGWLFTSAGATVLAVVFARLARQVPGSGGPYVYARAGFGDFLSETKSKGAAEAGAICTLPRTPVT